MKNSSLITALETDFDGFMIDFSLIPTSEPAGKGLAVYPFVMIKVFPSYGVQISDY